MDGMSSLGLPDVKVASHYFHLLLWLSQLAYEARGELGDDVSLIFGGITVASGITGVVSGAMWAKQWKERGNQVLPVRQFVRRVLGDTAAQLHNYIF